MRYRGRDLLTRTFLFLTGGIVTTVILGSIYFWFEPSLSVERFFVIPLLTSAAWVGYRFVVVTDIVGRLLTMLTFIRIPTMLTYAFALFAVPRTGRFRRLAKKIESVWTH